jgi:hypothetical protein
MEVPHGNSPSWSAMLTVYLDESGQEREGFVVIAGFLGNKSQWDEFPCKWSAALGTQRKSLHMSNLRFRTSDEALLPRLGAVPYNCGLTPVFGSVNVADYADLVKGTVAEIHGAGYCVALAPLVGNLRRYIPKDERITLVFEVQKTYDQCRDSILEHVSKMPIFRMKDGSSQLAGWTTVPKGSIPHTELADYLSFHLRHRAEDPTSLKCRWTTPIIGSGKLVGQHLSKEQARSIYAYGDKNTKLKDGQVKQLKTEMYEQNFNPWKLK